MDFNSRKLQRILFLVGLVSLLIIYLLSWVEMITDPVQRTASDFMAFYAAGRSMVEQEPAASYDLTHLQKNEEGVLGFKIHREDVNPFVHPPFILPILWVAAHFDYVPALHFWAAIMLVLNGLSSQIAVKLVPQAVNIDKVILWTGVFLFFPLYVSLENGQDSALLLLGGIIWVYGLRRNSNSMAGLGLALTTIRPQIALFLAVPFLFSRGRRNVWWWFCVFGSILAIASILLIGQDGVNNYLKILSVSASGEGYKINEIAMVNLVGLLKRLAPNFDASIIRMTGWASVLVGLSALCILFWRSPKIEERFIALSVILAVFTSVHLHYHDLALLVLPILILIRAVIEARFRFSEFAFLIPFGISFLLIFTYSIPVLNYPIIYLIELGLLAGIWLMNRSTGRNPEIAK